MNVVPLPMLRAKQVVPIIALVDLQVEYVSVGRAYHLETADAAVQSCARLLEKARKLRLPIAHFRQIHGGIFFNRATTFAGWIDSVKPHPNEYLYEREFPSCFSNKAFCDLIAAIEQPEIIFGGLTGDCAGLSTVIESIQRNCNITFVQDCAASSPLGDLCEAEAHSVICQIIKRHADVVSLSNVMGRLEKLSAMRWSK